MRRSIFAILLLIVVVMCCLVGAKTRAQFTDEILSDRDFEDYILGSARETLLTGNNKEKYIRNSLKVLDAYDLVATVRFTGKRVPMHYAVLSEVEVTEVHRGDTNLTGNNIAIYEQVHLYTTGGRKYYRLIYSATNLMNTQREYLVFLNQLNVKLNAEIPGDEFTGSVRVPELVELAWPPYIYPMSLKSSDIAQINSADMQARKYTFRDLEAKTYLAPSKQCKNEIMMLHQSVIEHLGLNE